MADRLDTTIEKHGAALAKALELCRIVDEIIGGIDPPPEYRTAMQVDAWTRGALDAQRAIEKALGNAR